MARRDPDDWLWQVGQELQKISEEVSHTRPMVATSRHWEPRADVLEEPHKLVVRVEISGVRGDEIQVVYVPERHVLVIRGVRWEEDPDERATFHQLEIPFGEFQREVKLPDVSIRAHEVRAQYRNGFLFVVIPKQERTCG